MTKLKEYLFNFKVILWGFLGVRQKDEFLNDIQKVNPLYLILSGFVGVILFVGILIFIIKFLVL